MKQKIFARLLALLCVLSMVTVFLTAPSVSPTQADATGVSLSTRGAVQNASTHKAAQVTRKVSNIASYMSSMKELVAYYKNLGLRYEAVFRDEEKVSMEAAAAPSAASGSNGAMPTPAPAMDMAMADSGGGENGFSTTNTQVERVDEGDIVKTDGKTIFVARGPQIELVSAQGSNMKRLSTIKLETTNAYVQEMYITGQKLIVVSSYWVQPETNGTAPSYEGKSMYAIWRPSKTFTQYLVYDVADVSAPELQRSFEIEGSPLSTRVIGSVLYFMTNQYLQPLYSDSPKPEEILPQVRDSEVSDELTCVPVTDIAYFPGDQNQNYLIVGAFDVSASDPVDYQTFIGAGQTVYMNEQSLFCANPEWKENGTVTNIFRFAIDGTAIALVASGTVTGAPINQYCMDEYNGVFRIATNDWNTRTSYVTTLDEDLKVLGRSSGLAPGENLQSVRFTGDTAYVVTFQNTDPLFVLDLSNPRDIKVLGELKIPGFSQYLHPIGNGLVVGFGRHTNELFVKLDDGTMQSVGFRDAGLKVSLFDVSDPKNPLEIDKLLLGNASYSPAFDNPRAFMVDRGKSQFAFPVSSYAWDTTLGNNDLGNFTGAIVVGVANRKLELRAKLKLPTDNEKYYDIYSTRVQYIGDTCYLAGSEGIVSFDYSTFAKNGSLSFPQIQYGNHGVMPMVE